ncbi:MAG: hypothetical protein JWN31_1658 [Frankiales bacterium]|nr:hypothetical protein [Frankiales bacterium]
MWEATCPPASLDALTGWLRDGVVPQALATAGCAGAEGFVGEGEPRLVLITRWSDAEAMAGWQEPANRDLTRAHAWTFRPLPTA